MPSPKKCIDAMAGAVEELVGDDKLHRLVFFLKRSNGGDGDDTLDAELLETMDIGAKVQFAGENAMAAPMTREKGDSAALENAADIGVGRSAEGRFDADFFDFGQARHRVEPAAADDSDFCLWQSPS